MNYEVVKQSETNDVCVSMAQIEPGQAGYIVQSPIPGYIGRAVICINVYVGGQTRRILDLNYPDSGCWAGDEALNIIRLLQPGEEIIIRGKN